MPVGKLDSRKELDTDKNTTEDERLITATVKDDDNAITIRLSDRKTLRGTKKEEEHMMNTHFYDFLMNRLYVLYYMCCIMS